MSGDHLILFVDFSDGYQLSGLALCPLQEIALPELLDFVLNIFILYLFNRAPQEARDRVGSALNNCAVILGLVDLL